MPEVCGSIQKSVSLVKRVFEKVCHWLRNDSMLVDMFSEPVAEFPCQSAMDFGPVENTAFPRFGIADQI